MTAHSFNVFIIFTLHLSFFLHPSQEYLDPSHSPAFAVIQPQSRTVNPDGSASVSCEHDADVNSAEDVRLNSISLTENPRLLCQRGKKDCKNVTMHQENPKKWLFILLNIGPEAMNMTYQCEFTLKMNHLDHTETGTPTVLLPGQQEATCRHHPPPPAPPPPPPPAPLQCHLLRWILIGLLALMLLYSCVITFSYITLKRRSADPENSIYVEMRNAPLQRNPHFDIYCGS